MLAPLGVDVDVPGLAPDDDVEFTEPAAPAPVTEVEPVYPPLRVAEPDDMPDAPDIVDPD